MAYFLKGPIKKFTRNQSISAGETTPSTSEQQNGDETAIEAGRNSAAGIAALSTFSHPLELLNGANNSKRETSADDFGELKTAKLRNRRMLISSRRHSENFPIPNFMSIKPKKRGNTAAPKKWYNLCFRSFDLLSAYRVQRMNKIKINSNI